MVKALYGVFGNPVAHSKSPQIHQVFADQAGIEIDYQKIEPSENEFQSKVKEFVAAGGKGFNVTLPFKEEAYALMSECSKRAARAEAVNTVVIEDEGRYFGDNTDGVGLVTDIIVNHGWTIADQKLLIIGAGGAVKGVLGSLVDEKPQHIVVTNRTLVRAEQLIKHYDQSLCEAKGFNAINDHYDLIINGTSASLSGKIPEIPASVIGSKSRCYDMVYAADETLFNRWAIDLGAEEAVDGLGMLVEQAARAFELWTGYRPKTADVVSRLRKQLSLSIHNK